MEDERKRRAHSNIVGRAEADGDVCPKRVDGGASKSLSFAFKRLMYLYVRRVYHLLVHPCMMT